MDDEYEWDTMDDFQDDVTWHRCSSCGRHFHEYSDCC